MAYRPPKVSKRRDLTIVKVEEHTGLSIVIACDSSGSIGEKKCDRLRTSPEITGMYTARVVLMELLSAGAQVISLCNTISCEMEPTGLGIIRGIEGELRKAGIDTNVLNGSTEENFESDMTAVGITAIGTILEQDFKFHQCQPGDRVVLIGRPMVGQAVLNHPEDAVSYETIKQLVADANVREIVPVGSKGIAYEAGVLAGLNNLTYIPGDTAVDLYTSGGPATCAIAAVKEGYGLPGSDIRGLTVVGMLQ